MTGLWRAAGSADAGGDNAGWGVQLAGEICPSQPRSLRIIGTAGAAAQLRAERMYLVIVGKSNVGTMLRIERDLEC